MYLFILNSIFAYITMSSKYIEELIADSGHFGCNDFANLTPIIISNLNPPSSSPSMFYFGSIKYVHFVVKITIYEKSLLERIQKNKSTLITYDLNEKIIKRLKKDIIEKNKSLGIIECFYTKICNTSIKRLYETKHGEYLIGKIYNPHRSYHDKYSIIVMERCHETLQDFLLRVQNMPFMLKILKSMLFQITHTLYVLQTLYPKYSHRDLHQQNIMIKYDNLFIQDTISITQYIKMNIEGMEYYIPYFGVIPKIIDFEHNYIPTIGISDDEPLFKELNKFPEITTDTSYLFEMIKQSIWDKMESGTKSLLTIIFGDINMSYLDIIKKDIFDEYRQRVDMRNVMHELANVDA